MKTQMKIVTGLTLAVFAVSVSAYLNTRPVVARSSTGSIVATGDMMVARFDHTATLLPGGQVLIVGGLARNGVMQPTAELYDSATGRFTPAGKLQAPRGWGATAVRLANGKVLIAGGSGGACVACILSSAELYDPASRTFSLTGSLSTPRAGAISILLPNDDALILGGTDTGDGTAATADIYHPGSGTFSPAAALHLSDPSQAVRLKNGKILVVGASGAELYDPSTGRFNPTGKMTVSRAKFGAALLPDGRVLIAGGQAGGPWGTRVNSTQIYNPASGTFAAGPEMNFKRFKLRTGIVALRDGRILIGGGAEQPELYDAATRAFVPVPGSKLDGFCFSTATLLENGAVLLAGGYQKPGGDGVNHAWLYKP